MVASARNPLEGAFFDLSTRTKLRLTGEDRQRYLNGQITNDLRKLSECTSIAACVLSAKGKTDAHIFVFQDQVSYVLDADPDLRETLLGRLERYVIADDVEIADVTDELSIFHVIGDVVPDVARGNLIRANRFGAPGYDIWIERSQRENVFALLDSKVSFVDEQAAEVFRVERGIPRWGHELTQEIIPVEANLEESCVDYNKGCYIGQEVISRMKMSGQRNKRLAGFLADDESRLAAGMRLMSTAGKEAGWITSAATSERFGRRIALGYVKRGADLPAGIKVVELPFSPDNIGSD